MSLEPRERAWPDRDLSLQQSVIQYFDFRLGAEDTIASVVRAYDVDTELALGVLDSLDWSAVIEVYGRQVRLGRFVADVLQESARHLEHLDILRELIDGTRGE